MAKYTKAQATSVKNYLEKNNLVQLRIWMPREEKETHERAAAEQGKSLSSYVRDRLNKNRTED